MKPSNRYFDITRRKFLASSAGAAAGVSLASGLSKKALAGEKTVKVGFLAALTGEVAGWGLPGLYGCEIWAEQVNAAGGIKVGNDNYMVEIVAYDDEYLGQKALTGAKKLILEDDVKIILMMTATPVFAVQPFTTNQEMLVTTLTPSDMSPERPYLIAASEVHPFYNVAGVEWLHRNYPEIKTAAICTQNDEIGMNGLASFRAAFEVTGIEIVEEKIYGLDTVDLAPVMSAMLASNPDVLSFDTSYPDFVNLLCEQAFLQGWEGPIVNCTLDNYEKIIEKTSVEFLEGFVWHFPDFDDPMLQGPDINFVNAAEFYKIYSERYPGAWNAVSWEYAANLALWKTGVEMAGSIEPMEVFKTLQSMDEVPHVFGPAKWWGDKLYGISNTPMGKWPVVQMQNGKAVIVEMGDVRGWLDEHSEVLARHLEDLNAI
jgi:branched-chain amino acid transport system substrate-binding protein